MLPTIHYYFSHHRNQYGQVTSGEYWIGLNRLDDTKGMTTANSYRPTTSPISCFPVTMVTITAGHAWSDGSIWDFSLWKEGEPNNMHKVELCTVAHITTPYSKPVTMTWNDRYCHVAHDYICQVPAGNTKTTTMIELRDDRSKSLIYHLIG